MLSLAGCGGYSAYPGGEKGAEGSEKKVLQMGGYKAGFLYPADIQTVYVQGFTSQEFRREIEIRLTEAVIKRILMETPYRLGHKSDADTILYGELRSVPVTLLGTDFDRNLPKENQIVLVVDWTWKNRRTGEVLAQQRGHEQAGEYIPLAGENFFDAVEVAVNRMSERIVERMRSDW